MGAVLAKIKGIVSKGNEAKDAKETVEDTECENPFCYSVAGPLHQQALFYIVVLVCVILFFVSLVPAAAGWKENIVTSDPTVVDEIEYPDMYLCHSPKLKHELTNGYGGAYVHTKYSSTDVSGANLQFGSTAKTTLDTGYSATVNTCPIMSVDDSYVKSLGCAGSMIFQADTPSGTNAAEQTDINLLRDARARVLNGYAYDKGDCSVTTPPAACTVTDSEASPTKPDCSLLRFNTFSKAERKGAPKYAVYLGELLKNDGNTPAAGLNVAYSSTTPVGNTDGTNGKTCSDPLEVYYTKRGESPVQNGEITASVALIPLCNNLFIGTISLRQVKDETAGDTDFKDEYIQSNYIVNTPDSNNGNTMVFRIIDFHVDKITIRAHGFSDIWAQLGGLWAASLVVLAFFFKSSGRLNTKGYELQIFQFLPKKMRNDFLTGTEAKDGSAVPKNDAL